MKKHIVFPALALGALLMTSACETPVETQRLPDITFAHLQPFNIDVADIEIINRYKAPLSAPHVEHRLPVSPASALSRWAGDRLKPVGSTGKLLVIIEDASATENALARDQSLKGKFTKQQTHRYDFAVRATLALMEGAGIERGTVSGAASRSVTIREDASLNDREKTWFDVLDRLMGDFNSEMDANLRQYLAAWLR